MSVNASIMATLTSCLHSWVLLIKHLCSLKELPVFATPATQSWPQPSGILGGGVPPEYSCVFSDRNCLMPSQRSNCSTQEPTGSTCLTRPALPSQASWCSWEAGFVFRAVMLFLRCALIVTQATNIKLANNKTTPLSFICLPAPSDSALTHFFTHNSQSDSSCLTPARSTF